MYLKFFYFVIIFLKNTSVFYSTICSTENTMNICQMRTQFLLYSWQSQVCDEAMVNYNLEILPFFTIKN